MDNIRVLCERATQLRQTIDRKRNEASHATQISLEHGSVGEYSRAADQASLAMRLGQEIRALAAKVIEAAQRIIEAEQCIMRLQQQGEYVRQQNFHRRGYIDNETRHRLDEIGRQVSTLRG